MGDVIHDAGVLRTVGCDQHWITRLFCLGMTSGVAFFTVATVPMPNKHTMLPVPTSG